MALLALRDRLLDELFGLFRPYGVQFQHDTGNHPFGMLFEKALPVRETALSPIKIANFLRFGIECAHALNKVFYLGPERCRIPTHCSSNGTWNAAQFLPAAEPEGPRRADECKKVRGCPYIHFILVDTPKIPHKKDDEHIKILVGQEHVAPARKNHKADIFTLRPFNSLAYLLFGAHLHQVPRRTTDLESR